MQLNNAQQQAFRRDGLLLLENILTADEVENLRDSFERLFRGEFETGIMPDEVNWQQGRSDPGVTRQICNGWRADRSIAHTICRQDLGRMVAELMGWPGTRVMQDNVLWKPAGAKSLGFHQDNAYLRWIDPGEICSVWMALDDVAAENGAMELVPGSHRWGAAPLRKEFAFHAPDDYRAALRKHAPRPDIESAIVAVTVARGGGSIHHGWTWHGSGPNHGNTPRRALVLHAMSSESRYRRSGFSEGTGPIYARYARLDSDEMDENYFPIIWRRDGYRTGGLDDGPGWVSGFQAYDHRCRSV